ncbi:MAG: PD-(D/E)XK nuclease family protein [Gammaproteobacteria bacterium]|nr:PD-(D/E)XK nuclease family protein [Gammaproteobacteria bacterium]
MNAAPPAPTVPPCPSIIVVPYSGDPLAELAARLIAHHEADLPDLAQAIVLTPDLHAAARLRRLLLEHARRPALLGPRITTLPQWIERTVTDRSPVLRSELRRELILVDVLRQHRRLLGAGSAWAMAESLLILFDELTRRQIRLPEGAELEAVLRRGYGMDAGQGIAALSREAALVDTLWRAWHVQHAEEGIEDPHAAYLDKLARYAAPPGQHFYLAGFTEFIPAERAWLQTLLARGQATLIARGNAADRPGADDYHPDAVSRELLAGLDPAPPQSPVASPDFIDAVFAALPADEQLAERAASFRRALPVSPVRERFHLFTADSAEDEARAIDIQIRRWLLEGRGEIGVVIEDRRLARRVRALLERAGVGLIDRVGWALSTTSAAAALERLLETVEEEFHYQPLLDLLKSPFLFPPDERETRLRSVYHLEQDIVLHENVTRGLGRYRDHIDYRYARLRDELGWSDEERLALHSVLDLLEEATRPLCALTRGRHPADRLLDALEHALRQLALYHNFARDAAGDAVLDKLREMRAALHAPVPTLDWLEFRTWLGRALERANFIPPRADGPVHLLTLAQVGLVRFDALIIANADARHLPGGDNPSPYFNAGVRRELGIPTAQSRLNQRFHHFRCALECAPVTLFTLHREADADALPSPWLTLLDTFHSLAYGNSFDDLGLAALARDPRAQIGGAAPAPWARSAPAPRVQLPAGLLPREYSATRYQRLIDCPYQFFAADCLGLSAPEEVREALEKADYGERIHRILEWFHGGDARRGIQPFQTTGDPHDRARAIACLEELSRRAFADDLEDNVVHRAWLQRWLEIVPRYVDWQLEFARAHRVEAVELRTVREDLHPGITLRGRLDRIDRGAEGTTIIDYKTGAVPGLEDVLSGEAVQLPFYALLLREPPQRVLYLGLDRDKVRAESVLEGEDLPALTHANAARLIELMEQMRAGAKLPAWGDQHTCERCFAMPLCRKQSWDDSGTSPGEAPA